ncbi:hypothetical protein [Pseudomonas sp. MWU13-2105]|uniref:hypothetical protein n=1 Tax=Pseudomonas sp. MWU13-2105 TaxID=2935074 RepID=UPI00200D0207|nr:hypothetical protein [Pseudomonas sp. MWU13-2105]
MLTGTKVAIFYKERIGFKSFHLASKAAGAFIDRLAQAGFERQDKTILLARFLTSFLLAIWFIA